MDSGAIRRKEGTWGIRVDLIDLAYIEACELISTVSRLNRLLCAFKNRVNPLTGWPINRPQNKLVYLAWMTDKAPRSIQLLWHGWPINRPTRFDYCGTDGLWQGWPINWTRDYQPWKDKNLSLFTLGLVHKADIGSNGFPLKKMGICTYHVLKIGEELKSKDHETRVPKKVHAIQWL